MLLHALPLFHIHGLFVACHCALLGASTMLFLAKFDADTVVRLLPRATVFMGVPTFYTRLLANARPSDVKLAATCDCSPPARRHCWRRPSRKFEARTGHRILERYGMTETGMNTSNPLDGPRVPETVGPPLAGVSVRIVSNDGRDLPAGEVGQLLVKGPNVFKGYWRQPDKTAEAFTADGWFRTGDLARRDANGYVAIVGRAKDLIITGGLNVYPKEIETYIDDLDGVAESAVIGLPHPDFGEAVTAVVVRAPGRADITEESLLQTLKQKIAGYKVPKRVFFVAELPRNAMGKVQKMSCAIAIARRHAGRIQPRSQPAIWNSTKPVVEKKARDRHPHRVRTDAVGTRRAALDAHEREIDERKYDENNETRGLGQRHDRQHSASTSTSTTSPAPWTATACACAGAPSRRRRAASPRGSCRRTRAPPSRSE